MYRCEGCVGWRGIILDLLVIVWYKFGFDKMVLLRAERMKGAVCSCGHRLLMHPRARRGSDMVRPGGGKPANDVQHENARK
jgi:hypothetical protein